MLSFKDAEALYATARDKEAGKPLENNTRLYRRSSWDGDSYYYAVQLHYTDVVEIYRDGRYVLNSGGWQTLTTKDRISKYGAGQICQRAFVWYWHPEGAWDESKLVTFESGMEVTMLRRVNQKEYSL